MNAFTIAVFTTAVIIVCVWIVWMFIIMGLMHPNSVREELLAAVVASAATILTIYLFNRFAPKRPN
jgi:hypothetical protein